MTIDFLCDILIVGNELGWQLKEKLLTIENTCELLAWKPAYHKSIISDGLLLPETGMIIFGSAKAWKSAMALHTGYCIANGYDWFGFKTNKSTVFKYQVELPKAVDRRRVEKYMNGNRPSNMFYKTAPYSKIDTSYGKMSLEKDIQIVQSRSPDSHVVLILDPIYLLITGHISDDYDIKKLLDSLNEMKAKHGITVILIHHTHKTRVDSSGEVIDLGSEEIMGSSYFNNWADTMVRVKLLNPYSGSNRVRMTFELARNNETGRLPSMELLWNRSNLRPAIIKREEPSFTDEISIRGLEEGGEHYEQEIN